MMLEGGSKQCKSQPYRKGTTHIGQNSKVISPAFYLPDDVIIVPRPSSLNPAPVCSAMPTSRFEPSAIKNKVKREEVVRRKKKAKTQAKLQKRVALAKFETNDPAAKKVRIGSIYYFTSLRGSFLISETFGR